MSNATSEINGLLEQLAELVAARLAVQLQGNGGDPLRPRLLNVDQAAAYIGCTKDAVQRLIAAGTLPTVRSDRRVFLDRNDLDEWIENHKEQ